MLRSGQLPRLRDGILTQLSSHRVNDDPAQCAVGWWAFRPRLDSSLWPDEKGQMG